MSPLTEKTIINVYTSSNIVSKHKKQKLTQQKNRNKVPWRTETRKQIYLDLGIPERD